MTEEAEIIASKKALEKHISDVSPESTQYRNITIVKSLDPLKFQVDHDKLSKLLAQKKPKPEDYAGVPPTQFKLLVLQAEKEFTASVQRKVNTLNAEVAEGSYKNITGVCMEFNTKMNSGNYGKPEKALCLYKEGETEADCINLRLEADKNALFNIDLAAICP